MVKNSINSSARSSHPHQYPNYDQYGKYVMLAPKRYTGSDMKKKNIGSSFDNWLREEGIFEEVTVAGLKRVLARQIVVAMKEKQLSMAEMARRIHTSRTTLGRLLDPEHDAVTLNTLRKVAATIGSELRLEFVSR